MEGGNYYQFRSVVLGNNLWCVLSHSKEIYKYQFSYTWEIHRRLFVAQSSKASSLTIFSESIEDQGR